MSQALFIAGATGKQGGAVLRALLSDNKFSPSTHTIYAMTRDPNSASAKRLEAKSPAIKLVQGDLNDAAGAFKNLPVKPFGVFIVTNPQTKPKTEDEVGKSLVDEAITAGAQHIVFSGVERGSANGGFNRTNVPHFKTKHDIEEHLIAEAKKAGITYTILRPVFFLDNLEWGFIGKVIATAWRDHVKGKLQVIDTEDIGKAGAKAFLNSEDAAYRNQAISLAGDDLTFDEANKIFKDKVGTEVPTTFGFLASLMLWMSHDMREMFNFFNDPGYQTDIEQLKKLVPVSDFSQWVDKSNFMKKQQ